MFDKKKKDNMFMRDDNFKIINKMILKKKLIKNIYIPPKQE